MTDRLEAAAQAYRAAEAAVAEAKKALAAGNESVRAARPALADAIVEATREGRKQADIVRITGYTRERIRQICRAAGLEPTD
jgi:hypothetical protein